MIHALPAYVRQLAEDVTADGRSVLADWFEEQGELATAESLRAGGLAAQIVMLSLFAKRPDEPDDAVFIRGELAFEWCSVDLDLSRTSNPVRSIARGYLGEAPWPTMARARVRGQPSRYDLARDDVESVVILAGNALVTIGLHEWTWRHASPSWGVVLDIEMSGVVTSHEIVNRSTGAMTRSTP